MSRPPLGSSVNILGLSIQWYSLLIMIAVATGIFLATREEKRLGLPSDTVLNFSLLAIPLALIGARLYYVAFTWSRFENNLLEIFRLWNGGLAIYGGILGAVLAAFLVTRSGKVRFPMLLDICAPSLALGQAIGRWGNYANMEAYGARIYDPAAQFFPLAVEIPIVGAEGATFWYWHMATFFYESLWCLIIFVLLWNARKRTSRSGDVILWYVLLYCAGRTVIEGLRSDSLMINVSAAQVRISQVLSAIACVAVVIVFFRRLSHGKKKLRAVDFLAWAQTIAGIACAMLGEFESNAYQMLFIPSQLLVAFLLLVDIAFLTLFLMQRRRRAPLALTLGLAFCGVLCVLLLIAGAGRLGGSNTAFIALRQAAAMLHVAYSGLWFYMRSTPRRHPHPQEKATQEVARHAAT